MLMALIAAHLGLAVCAPLLARVLGQRTFLLAALAPATAFAMLVGLGPTVLSGGVVVETLEWIPALGVALDFRIGLVQWLLSLVVTGIGAVVLAYCRWYFEADPPQARVVGLLTAFCAAMIGLVTADDLVVVYVFWEATTVFSYLLIGHDPTRRANRSAALTALIVTTTGGLAMLVGLLALGHAAGTYSLAAIVAAPPSGPVVAVAALLVLVGALSKSALVPFHFWLPGAMAAPTPISAYLHAAAMVKAGVYLVAVLAPALAASPGWRPAVWVLGALTLFLGGWRALRQDDLKLLLAYGTVSQLGLLVLLLGTGTRAAALGGLAMVLAHALFKATLFLVVGVVDHSAGTRQLSQLSGLHRRLPVTAVVAAVAAASMAGLPPTIGFMAKEAGLEGLTNLALTSDGTGIAPVPGWALVAVVVVGSAITVAYSLRFWWGAFGSKPGVAPSGLDQPPSAGFAAGPVLLALASLAAGFVPGQLTAILEPYAQTLATGEESHGLVLVPSPGAPLYASLIAIVAGAVLFWQRERIAAVQQTFPAVPAAADLYRTTMRGLDRLAVEVTDRTQRGSLASYVGTILVVLTGALAVTLAGIRDWPAVHLADNAGQVMVGLLVVVAGFLVATSRGRLRALVLLGVAGYGTAVLFLLHGAPDLALTQVLVETVSLLVFLLVLRKLPKYFTERPLTSGRWWRVLISAATGVAFTLVAVLMIGSRTATPVSAPYPEVAKSFGYGNNIVNVVLVDTRAWDTIGEIAVLSIAATGVASLIFLRGRASRVRRAELDPLRGWLRGSRALPAGERSLMFEVVTRLLFPLMMIVSVYLLVAGHNLPGGGFAGGLVAGTALLVRYLAGGGSELDEAMPIPAGALLGSGLVVSVLTAITPLTVGGLIFQSYDVHIRVPGWESLATPWGSWTLLGDIHLVSSTAFDIGVYLVVLGMMLDLGRSLGSGIDVQARDGLTPAPEPESNRAIPGRRWDR
ncbi:NAD(P)H-quinone oxidoreductase subunit 2, chloroplastic [Propionicimonas sp. T2.31MG-18]|uniref:Na+/H+ antiporter subunit A n=1 Tax=Propionicimonas sp. T2.31MG-18 TaxID=3157620 RepID=UPI0035E7BEFA